MTSTVRVILMLLPAALVETAWRLGTWPLIGWMTGWCLWALLMAEWPAVERCLTSLRDWLHRQREAARPAHRRCLICQTEALLRRHRRPRQPLRQAQDRRQAGGR